MFPDKKYATLLQIQKRKNENSDTILPDDKIQ